MEDIENAERVGAKGREHVLEPSEILFIGRGCTAQTWYRIALPGIYLNADWVGVYGEPPALVMATGIVKGNTSLPKYEDYRVVVIEQPHGNKWLSLIRRLRSQGVKVLYEVDDYLHGVAKQKSHDWAHHYTKQRLREHETCMRMSDGIICSTEYIARRYAKFNKNVYICRNGLDVGRFNLTRPERPTVNFGWAGATGHLAAMVPWLQQIGALMEQYDDTCFVSIGDTRPAEMLGQQFGPSRCTGIPFTALENYPAAMTMIDIAIAPSNDSSWYRGKSDLRWLEASALGIPLIADRRVYPEIEEGVTGFWADSPAEMYDAAEQLYRDEELRRRVGTEARETVRDERSMQEMAPQWYEVACAVNGGYESTAQLPRA